MGSMRHIKESDWKLFRKLHAISLERFCQRIIQELNDVTSRCVDNYHDCYLNVYSLLRKRDREMAHMFDDPRRSNALDLLTNIMDHQLLTADEFSQFSLETRETVKSWLEARRA
jgi:hypothetical protein